MAKFCIVWVSHPHSATWWCPDPPAGELPPLNAENIEEYLGGCHEKTEYTGILLNTDTGGAVGIGKWSKHKPCFVVRKIASPDPAVIDLGKLE